MTKPENLIANPSKIRAFDKRIVATAAHQRGLELSKKGTYLRISNGSRAFLFSMGWISAQGQFSRVFRHKQATKDVLKAVGLPVPEGALFSKEEGAQALKYARYLGWPVAVKPDKGIKGGDVYVNIRSAEEFSRKFDKVSEGYSAIVVERMIPFSSEYRFLYLNKKIVGITKRIPANVVGNGRSTLHELIDEKNAERKARGRGLFPQILLDDESHDLIAEHGLALDSIPPEGQTVFLKRICNLAAGGDTVNVQDMFHPSYAEYLEECLANVRGCFILGLDVFVRDSTKPCSKENMSILEINDAPGYRGLAAPWEGPAVDLGGIIIDALFPETAEQKDSVST